jgi:hypothetical protein
MGDSSVTDLQCVEVRRLALSGRAPMEEPAPIGRDSAFRPQIRSFAEQSEEGLQGFFEESLRRERILSWIGCGVKSASHQASMTAERITVTISRHVERQESACLGVEDEQYPVEAPQGAAVKVFQESAPSCRFR